MSKATSKLRPRPSELIAWLSAAEKFNGTPFPEEEDGYGNRGARKIVLVPESSSTPRGVAGRRAFRFGKSPETGGDESAHDRVGLFLIRAEAERRLSEWLDDLLGDARDAAILATRPLLEISGDESRGVTGVSIELECGKGGEYISLKWSDDVGQERGWDEHDGEIGDPEAFDGKAEILTFEMNAMEATLSALAEATLAMGDEAFSEENEDLAAWTAVIELENGDAARLTSRRATFSVESSLRDKASAEDSIVARAFLIARLLSHPDKPVTRAVIKPIVQIAERNERAFDELRHSFDPARRR
jgi:hypothetical protein